jgi:hypothetical protein
MTLDAFKRARNIVEGLSKTDTSAKYAPKKTDEDWFVEQGMSNPIIAHWKKEIHCNHSTQSPYDKDHPSSVRFFPSDDLDDTIEEVASANAGSLPDDLKKDAKHTDKKDEYQRIRIVMSGGLSLFRK